MLKWSRGTETQDVARGRLLKLSADFTGSHDVRLSQCLSIFEISHQKALFFFLSRCQVPTLV